MMATDNLVISENNVATVATTDGNLQERFVTTVATTGDVAKERFVAIVATAAAGAPVRNVATERHTGQQRLATRLPRPGGKERGRLAASHDSASESN